MQPGSVARRGNATRKLCRLILAVSIVVVTSAATAASAETVAPGSEMTLPARVTAHSSATRHFEFVFTGGSVEFYDIDRGNAYVGRFAFPNVPIRGLAADPAKNLLFVAYGGSGGSAGNGSMLAYSLVSGRTVWQRSYPTGVDNIAITPDGRTIYLAVGEASNSDVWNRVDAANGDVTGSIAAGFGPHETIIGQDGRYVYLGGVDTPYLYVASTKTNRPVRKIGPLHPPGVRPFTINGAQTLAFTTSWSFLGFQVSSITTGRVLYSVAPPGFPFDPGRFTSIPDHGISLSPDGRQLYLVDTAYGYVHAFDVSGLPQRAPRDIRDIKLAHPPPGTDSWLQHSRDGRYVYVGLSGDVIDTRTRKLSAFLPSLRQSTQFIEIDWRHGRPVSATSRYGVGYA